MRKSFNWRITSNKEQAVRSATLVVTLFLYTLVFAETNSNPIGLWNTFDDDGTLLSTVNVRLKDKKLYGNIVAVHVDGEKNPICNQCKGDLHGKPIIGMQILNGLSLKNNIWQNGTVFDPETGDDYRAKVWLADGKLVVRGHVGFFYDTLYWKKAAKSQSKWGQRST